MNWQDPDAAREAERYDSPIPSRTLIQQTIESRDDGLSHAELVEEYQLDQPDAIEALSRRLSAMVRDGNVISDTPTTHRRMANEERARLNEAERDASLDSPP